VPRDAWRRPAENSDILASTPEQCGSAIEPVIERAMRGGGQATAKTRDLPAGEQAAPARTAKIRSLRQVVPPSP
jgi:hypothetical protein